MTDSLRLAARTYHTPKAGNTSKEYEDAFAGDPQRHRFAIADGASESAFADAWAQILVNDFVQSPNPWPGWLEAARERWLIQVQKRGLPWFAEAKFQEGAYAALLGIAFTPGVWHAAAIGDCCFFQVREGKLLQAFPLRHSSEFGNRPSLLGSRRQQADETPARMQGDLASGDSIFLMTDALGDWFLKNVEAGRRPWKQLQAIASEEQFAKCMKKLRDSQELRNDDVTLTMIQPQSS